MTQDTHSPIDPATTPLFIGAGIEFEGKVRHRGPTSDTALILGTLKGDLDWNGTLHVPLGGKLVIEQSMRVREMVVAGEITGANDSVTVEAGLLRLAGTGVVDVASVRLPTGGLEQARGSVLNAQLRMSKEHPFAGASNEIPDAVAIPPILALGAAPTRLETSPDAGALGAGSKGDGVDADADDPAANERGQHLNLVHVG